MFPVLHALSKGNHRGISFAAKGEVLLHSCLPDQVVEHRAELLMIWYPITLMWCNCNGIWWINVPEFYVKYFYSHTISISTANSRSPLGKPRELHALSSQFSAILDTYCQSHGCFCRYTQFPHKICTQLWMLCAAWLIFELLADSCKSFPKCSLGLLHWHWKKSHKLALRTIGFPSQRASDAENASMSCRHHIRQWKAGALPHTQPINMQRTSCCFWFKVVSYTK